MNEKRNDFVENPPITGEAGGLRSAISSPPGRHYTLEPLRRQGTAALICSDIAGMEWVKLKEIRFFWGGLGNEIEIRRADDIFASLKSRGRTLPTKARIIRASFVVKFSDSKTPRAVAIRPIDTIETSRDEDRAVLERWLEVRGYMLTESRNDRPTAFSPVASA